MQLFDVVDLRLVLGLQGRNAAQQLGAVLIELLIQRHELLVGSSQLIDSLGFFGKYIAFSRHFVELRGSLLVLLFEVEQFRLKNTALLSVVLMKSVHLLTLLSHELIIVALQALVSVLLLYQTLMQLHLLFLQAALSFLVFVHVAFTTLLLDRQVLSVASLENAELLAEQILAPLEMLPLILKSFFSVLQSEFKSRLTGI